MSKNTESIVGRHARAIRILTCLQSGPVFNARELAARMQVSRRTIYRDLNLIRGAGFRIDFDGENSGYRVAHDSVDVIVPPGFSDRDLAKLALTSHLSMLHGLPGFGTAVKESLARLLVNYPQNVRESISRVLNCCTVEMPAPRYSAKTLQIIEEMMAAIAKRHVVRLQYEDADEGKVIWTKFAPYRIVAGLEEWSILGRSVYHRRTIRLPASQVTDIEPLKERYHVPHGFQGRAGDGLDFSLWDDTQASEPTGASC